MGRTSIRAIALLLSLCLPANAFFTPFAFFDAASVPAAIAYVTSSSSSANSNTYTYSAIDTGTASADRYTVVGVFGGGVNNTTITSVTLDNGGGATAMTLVRADNNGSNSLSIYIIANPTGTTANVVATFSNTKGRSIIGVWALTSLNSSTPVDTDVSTASPGAITLTTQVNGVAVGIASTLDSTSYTWTNLTENYDTVVEAGNTSSGASATTSSTSLSITATQGSSNQPVFLAASWR